MGAAHRDSSDNPFAFCNLLLDREMRIRERRANPKNMLFRPLEADRIPPVLMDLDVFRGNETRDLVNLAGIDDLLVVASYEFLVLLDRQE